MQKIKKSSVIKIKNYLYSSEEEHEKQDKKQEEQEEQDKKPFGLDDLIELIINREKLPINNELFKKHFQLESHILMHKVLYDTKHKEKKVN